MGHLRESPEEQVAAIKHFPLSLSAAAAGQAWQGFGERFSVFGGWAKIAIFGEPPIPGDLPLEAQKLRFEPELLTGLLFGHRVPAAHRARLERAFLAAPRAREVFTVTGGVPFQQLSIIRSRRT